MLLPNCFMNIFINKYLFNIYIINILYHIKRMVIKALYLNFELKNLMTWGWNYHPIFHADLDETLRKSIAMIYPLLPVAREPERKVFFFCKSLSDFSRQFNNFFLRGKKAAFVFFQSIFVLWLRWHGFWTAPCWKRSQTEGSFLSALAIITKS